MESNSYFMKAKLHHVFSITIFLCVFSVFSQNTSWKKVENIKDTINISKFQLDKNKVHVFKLNMSALKSNLSSATLRASKSKTNNTVISIPSYNGKLESFQIYEAPVFAPELAAKYPNIKSYIGISASGNRLRMSISPQGIQTMISSANKPRLFMQPADKESDEYILYDKNSKRNHTNSFKCNTIDEFDIETDKSSDSKIDEGGANDKTLQTFRIAISTTSEYTAYHDDGNAENGNAIADALAAVNASISRVNEIFETDMAVAFQVIANNNLIIYNNAATDPYSDFSNLKNWSSELQTVLNSEIGSSNYDIGHLFGHAGGAGNSGCIGCVCNDINKGRAYTSPVDNVPEGDAFDINFLVHEIGHQMGARHTWSFKNEGPNSPQVEPGNGSTIMAYAGIRREDNIQLNSDDYFHYSSIKQILDNLKSKICQVKTPITNNNNPSADAGFNYIIPQGTPYILEGNATDTNGSDNLTYCWEQIDRGIVNSNNFSSSLSSGSINRSLPPSTSPNRYIPNINNVINGRLTESNPAEGSSWESVSTVSRTLNWALTIRDRSPSTVMANGQSSYDTKVITVDDTSGPFTVTSQSLNTNWIPGATETITWNVANTDSGLVNTSKVNILLSLDGGLTFPTTLLSNTDNVGSASITVPMISEPFCRIKVEGVNNIFYALNDETFPINYTINTTGPNTYDSPSNLNLDINDSTETTHIINVPDSGIISDVKVSMDINHTYINDLIVKITHPNGISSVNVWTKNCHDEDDIIMTFEDWADNIDCSLTGLGNTVNPAELLEIFNGLDAAGNWQISITDLAKDDQGKLNSWTLDISTQTVTLTTPNFNEDIKSVKVFPNPSNEGELTVFFKSESNDDIKIHLFDVRGLLIFNKSYPNTGIFRKKLPLTSIKSGMYLLSIDDGQMTASKKVIVN